MNRVPRNQSRRRQRGLTLMELLLAIAVGLVIVGVGVGLYASTNSSAKGYNASNQIMQIAALTQELHAQSPSYAGLTSATLTNTGRLPPNMVNGTAIVGALGGAVDLAPATINGLANAGFSITITNVPKDQCISMVMGLQNAFAQIQAGTVSGSTFTGVTPLAKDSLAATPILPTVATATTACDRTSGGLRFTGQ